MTFNRKCNIADFLKAVSECHSDVLFCTNEGDSLNLKSTLSKFVFASVCMQGEFVDNGTVVFTEQDAPRLKDYLI